MTLFPFYTAHAHLHDFHGISIDEDEFETIAIHAYDKIGNKRTRMYKIGGMTENCVFELPCNVLELEMVTECVEDHQIKDDLYNINVDNRVAETVLDKSNATPDGFYYMNGRMIDYELDEHKLHFKKNLYVNVLYKGELLDDEGLPKLNHKQVEAIANYCAYTHLYKKGLATRDPNTIQLANMIKAEWNRTVENARVPEYMNQNEINEILQAQSSWDRKRYNVSFKPLRK